MKVLHVSDHLPGYHKSWGGAEQVAYRYLKLLEKSPDVDIVVATTKITKTVGDNFKLYRVFTIEDFFPEKYKIFITGIKNRIISLDPLSFISFITILLKEKPQVVHFHKFNKISFSAVLASKLLRKRIVFGIYDYWYFCPATALVDQKGELCEKFHGSWCKDCDAVTDFRIVLPFISPFRRPIFDFFYRMVDAYAVLSINQGMLLEKYGIPNNKIFLVRQVFDFSKIRPVVKTNKLNTILFSGWMDPRKGLHVIIEAMPVIIERFPNIVLQVFELTAISSYREKVNKRIRELKLENNVKIFQKLPWEEFNKYLAGASVVVVPEQWVNMSPALVVESMANGKAVVASNVGGIPEFIQDGKNGYLAERTSPEDFTKKIINLLQNPKKAEDFGRKAAADIFILCDQKAVLKSLLDLYKRI